MIVTRIAKEEIGGVVGKILWVEPQREGGARLGIEIDEENPLAGLDQRCGNRDRRGGLGDSTLLVRHCYNPAHTLIVVGSRRSTMSVTFTWQLPMDSTAPAAARWHLREVASSDLEAVDAELVVTELVTNAWKHGTGAGDITVTVEVRDASLRIEVCGIAEGSPAVHSSTDESDDGGRGLLLLDGLVEEWGYDRRENLMCVWATVAQR